MFDTVVRCSPNRFRESRQCSWALRNKLNLWTRQSQVSVIIYQAKLCKCILPGLVFTNTMSEVPCVSFHWPELISTSLHTFDVNRSIFFFLVFFFLNSVWPVVWKKFCPTSLTPKECCTARVFHNYTGMEFVWMYVTQNF